MKSAFWTLCVCLRVRAHTYIRDSEVARILYPALFSRNFAKCHVKAGVDIIGPESTLAIAAASDTAKGDSPHPLLGSME